MLVEPTELHSTFLPVTIPGGSRLVQQGPHPSLDIPSRSHSQSLFKTFWDSVLIFTRHSFQNPFPVHDGRATFCTWATLTRHSFQ